ncbi:MAG: response regulator [Methanospirillum sp.]|uniref:response regulator n=1 Tax=Methanospirillum sp. TaxID=45200 RepID=UPI0023758160|nr:response regulator [Methanospirillum sp.]MDD1728770.1 response regulator [Methanospirillum sp.]
MPIQVLYVDDEIPHLMLAQEYLGHSGKVELTCVSSGREAIEALEKGSFQVIVSDYQMQDMNGVTLLKYIRKNFGNIPFLLFTGKGKEEVVIEALNHGADYYIRKGSDPFEQFAILEQRILQVADKKDVQEELAAREKLYQSVLTVQSEYLVDFLPDLTIIHSNESFSSQYGGAPTDMIGRKFLSDLSPEDHDELLGAINLLTPDNGTVDLQQSITASDGSPLTYSWHIEGVFATDGQLVSCKATGRDISNEGEAREDIREYEEKYQEAATDIPKDLGDFDENIPLNFIIENTRPIGTWLLPELIRQARASKMNGIASATGQDGHRAFLIFQNGEPEGGIYIDRSGVLYGDKSILFLKDSHQFTFYPTAPEVSTRFVTGCRIYDKSHIRAPNTYEIPEIPSIRKGIGNITIILRRGNKPLPGIRVTIKSGGKIVGNDVTSALGQSSFQLLYGSYTGVVLTESGNLHTFSFQVKTPDSSHAVDLT